MDVRGRTIRFRWTDGPTKGKTHEHVFHEDGTVEWHDVESAQQGQGTKERPKYGAERVGDGVAVVSYLSSSGYTLTVVLNERDRSIVGFASGARDWFPVRGTYELVAGKR